MGAARRGAAERSRRRGLHEVSIAIGSRHACMHGNVTLEVLYEVVRTRLPTHTHTPSTCQLTEGSCICIRIGRRGGDWRNICQIKVRLCSHTSTANVSKERALPLSSSPEPPTTMQHPRHLHVIITNARAGDFIFFIVGPSELSALGGWPIPAVFPI